MVRVKNFSAEAPSALVRTAQQPRIRHLVTGRTFTSASVPSHRRKWPAPPRMSRNRCVKPPVRLFGITDGVPSAAVCQRIATLPPAAGVSTADSGNAYYQPDRRPNGAALLTAGRMAIIFATTISFCITTNAIRDICLFGQVDEGVFNCASGTAGQVRQKDTFGIAGVGKHLTANVFNHRHQWLLFLGAGRDGDHLPAGVLFKSLARGKPFCILPPDRHRQHGSTSFTLSSRKSPHFVGCGTVYTRPRRYL